MTTYPIPEEYQILIEIKQTVMDENIEKLEELFREKSIRYYFNLCRRFSNDTAALMNVDDDKYNYYYKICKSLMYFSSFKYIKSFKFIYQKLQEEKVIDLQVELNILCCVASNGSPEVMQFLIDEKFDINFTEIGHYNALNIAFGANNKPVVLTLIKNGVDVNQLIDGHTIFHDNLHDKKPEDLIYLFKYCTLQTLSIGFTETTRTLMSLRNYNPPLENITLDEFQIITDTFGRYIDHIENFQNNNNVLTTIENYNTLQPIVKEKYIVEKILSMKYDMEKIDFQ